ncbi:polycystic kidney disease 2-like 1 protein [Scaptodrosophila lebanonensis]|uniref:Polycystic kidney disease 2-like 1 protein n=1 Tax=Drosophila lebanonensis TaxID=7225 RepID=A0A6J2U7I2_DROLE|nr:polycystic kidney disease 2-like 1 protein [Scaptodrosophila lebanonensis]
MSDPKPNHPPPTKARKPRSSATPGHTPVAESAPTQARGERTSAASARASTQRIEGSRGDPPPAQAQWQRSPSATGAGTPSLVRPATAQAGSQRPSMARTLDPLRTEEAPASEAEKPKGTIFDKPPGTPRPSTRPTPLPTPRPTPPDPTFQRPSTSKAQPLTSTPRGSGEPPTDQGKANPETTPKPKRRFLGRKEKKPKDQPVAAVATGGPVPVAPPPKKKIRRRRGMYTTEEEVKEALIEMAVFIIFLLLTVLVTFSVRNLRMYHYNDMMSKLFYQRDIVIVPSVTVSLVNIITVQDWWDYLIYNFFITLHGDTPIIYDHDDGGGNETSTANGTETNSTEAPASTNRTRLGRDLQNARPLKAVGGGGGGGGGGGAGGSAIHGNFTLFPARTPNLVGRMFLKESLLLGPPRLRQIRVRKDTCDVNDAFIRYFNTCYGAYSDGIEQRTSEHGGVPYKTMSQLDATAVWAELNFYRSGGYTVDLTYDRDKNLEMMEELKSNHWIDRGSRLCLIEFNLFNENLNLFQSLKFIAEMPPSGGVLPQEQIQAVKQFSFFTDESLMNLVVYIFWYIMVVYYTIYAIIDLRKVGWKYYYKSLLNWLDTFIIVFAYLALIYNVWHTFKIHSIFREGRKGKSDFQSLDSLLFWNELYVDLVGLLAFLVWVKIFKFISFNKTLVQFTTTLKRCSKDLAGFSLMFAIVFLAYAQLGLLLFGTKHPDFRNFITSILTMIRMILGDFQYQLIEKANYILGPIYFLTYILIVFFILLNMFLAIIMETYNTVKGEISPGELNLGLYFYKMIGRILYYITHCGRKSRAPPANPNLEEGEFREQPRVATKTHAQLQAEHMAEMQNEAREITFRRLGDRISMLEDILEKLVTNMDELIKRAEKQQKKRLKKEKQMEKQMEKEKEKNKTTENETV